jgi:hypothetical protein
MSSAGEADKEGDESEAEDSDLDLGREQGEQGADSDEVCICLSHPLLFTKSRSAISLIDPSHGCLA